MGTAAAALQVTAQTGAQGKELLRESASARAVVLIFVASDCVISDRYFPETERLQGEFAARGVRFWWVYPNRTETLAAVQIHQRQFAATAEDARMDPDGALTQLAGARATPEAAVLVHAPRGGWRTKYRGRIDDRYVRLGVERPRAQHHDLEDAIAAVLAGKAARPPGGPTVGCAIMSTAGMSTAGMSTAGMGPAR